MSRIEKPAVTQFLVTVDTEEDDAWSGFRATGNTVRNAEGLDRFQRLCDRYEIRPTYLVDEPVVDDALAVERLAEFASGGRAEVGAHLHPWCCQPLEEETNDRNSYLCNLPKSLQHAKLAHLTNRIEQQFGHRPTSFRAGRYGLDQVGFSILAELGYTVDSSVIPFTNYTAQHGPNFDTAPHQPYFPAENNLCEQTSGGQLLEVPVSVGFNRANFERARRWRKIAMLPGLRHLRAVGILDRLGMVRRIKLSPEQADAARMKSLVDAFRTQDAPCAVLMLHSSSFTHGTSPYVRTEDTLERLYQRLSAIFDYCRNTCRMDAPTLSQFAEHYRLQHAGTNETALQNH